MALHHRTHPKFVPGCFGCKAASVNLAVGDANSNASMAQSKWDKELALYKSARAQGIQPATTKTKDIRKAIEISNKTGRAFDAGS
jgi:hypothetical protein